MGIPWRDYLYIRTYVEQMISLVEEEDMICEPIDWFHPSGQTWIVFTDSKVTKGPMASLGKSEAKNHPEISEQFSKNAETVFRGIVPVEAHYQLRQQHEQLQLLHK